MHPQTEEKKSKTKKQTKTKPRTLPHHNMDISLLNYCTNNAPYTEQALLHYQKIIQAPVLKGDSDFTSVLVHRGLETPKILPSFVYN